MKKISWNSPVILSFTFISAIILFLNAITKGYINTMYFSIYKSNIFDPYLYFRLFSHILGHANLQHYTANMVIFLLVGPLLEEKYGSGRLLFIISLVALITGLVHILLPGYSYLLGASGVDFAFILLASVTGHRHNNTIPLTLLIVAIIYIGQAIYQGITVSNNISELTHIIGGAIGAFCGLALQKHR